MKSRLFKNISTLSRFIFKKDRFKMALWIVGIVGFTLAVAVAFPDLYRTAAERQQLAASMVNPAVTALVGRGYGLDDYTYGAMMAHQMLGMTTIIAGLMNILLVAKHTRADEEAGLTEMILSLPSGRLSTMGASMAVMAVLNSIMAVAVGLGLFSTGIESLDLEGSLLYGAVIGAIGLFFAAVTALCAQLTESTRGTIGLSIAVLGGAYLIRAAGDVSNETLSWFSPIGWVLGTETYVNNYWWPIILTLAATLCIAVLAFYLNTIRDVGAGFFPSKPGRMTASLFLRSPFGLALRLQRSSLVFWTLGIVVLAVTYGSVLGETEIYFEDIEFMEEFLPVMEGVSLTDQFLAVLMAVMAIIITIPALLMILKLKGEEKNQRLESLFSLPVSRIRMMGSYLLLAMLSSVFLLLVSGLAMGSMGVAVIEEAELAPFITSSLVYLPAVWVMLAVTALLIGFLPKYTGLIWLYLGFSFMTVYFGDLFQMPGWLTGLTPFDHVPGMPVDEFNFMSAAVMIIVAVTIGAAGFFGYLKRDIHG
ncbi:ABC transporter permease [Salipaludibacillus aurantiacus]|uniref:ABC-2 type transport system permease protein n=1 Tax=Salipaludibacillus aurantiacus TaxID=1601833 RepID=A0A1H9V0X4_9BACI|nr:ABC transporter permease [Salipaludibacillus aurantiacus]SES14913.1 ABC-2 type transport system permease protein [Salipaludibacillus aurantiacus]